MMAAAGGESIVKEDWQWQAVFFFATVGCIALARFVFESSALTWLITVVQAGVALSNLLFENHTTGTRNGHSWASTKLKHLLNVTPLLRGATIAVCVLFIGLASYAALSWWKESHLLSIAGYVQEADGSLARNASVSLTIGPNTQTMLATDGKFSFTRLDVRSKDSSAFAVLEAHWNGKRASKAVDLRSRDLNNEIIRLPLGHAPFRLRYYLLGGHAIDFFLSGKIDEHWETQLAGQPYIIRNSTFETLSAAVTRFSEPFRHGLLMTPDYAKRTQSGEAYSQEAQDYARQLADKFRGMPMFVGTDGSIAAASLGRPASREDIKSLADSNSGWHAMVSPYGDPQPKDEKALIYWRYGTPADLQKHSADRASGQLVSWLQYVTKDYFPHDFCILSMNGSECGGYHEDIAISARSVHLRVAVIENITAHPIHLGAFTVRETSANRLRTRDEDQVQLLQQDLRSRQWFPPEDLQPGEKLAVSLEITFRYDKDKNWDLYHIEKDSNRTLLNDLRRLISEKPAVTFAYYDNQSEREISMPSASLVRLLDEPAASFGLQREYIYGPSTKLESVDVDDAEYPIRQFDPHVMVIRDGDETGSCPFVYTYSARDKAWVSQGRILYGANGSKGESVDSLKIDRLEGSILIREEEAETSFFKTIYISSTDRFGSRRIFYPTNWKLLRRKSGYVELRQGDVMKLKFAFPDKVVHADLRLVARGYYRPY